MSKLLTVTALSAGVLLGCLLFCGTPYSALAQTAHSESLMESFELVWSTLRDQYWDATMGGLNWQAIHDQYRRKIQSAKTAGEARQLMSEMIERLPSSHLAIIPQWAYAAQGAQDVPAPDNKEPARDGSTGITVTVIEGAVVVETVAVNSAGMESGVRTGWKIESVDGQAVRELFSSIAMTEADAKATLMAEMVEHWLAGPIGSQAEVFFLRGDGTEARCRVGRRAAAGKLVEFGNLPPEHVNIEYRKLENGVGYIRLNLFLDPVSVMPQVENAIHEFKDAAAVILDLRGNPGGLGVMAMGIAGWFVSREGLELGTMSGRAMSMKFEINPRLEAYTGKMAMLVDGQSASTTEILAQGLQDLGRARIFGTRTAGAALPSEIIELPDGDRFQYPEANYTSVKGRVLEGNGVRPDVVVRPTVAALLAGRDLVLEAASAWSASK